MLGVPPELLVEQGFTALATSGASWHGAGKDSWVVVCSDGLCGSPARGAGGGLSNREIAAKAQQVGRSGSADDVAAALVAAAREVGSTDDVTVVALRL